MNGLSNDGYYAKRIGDYFTLHHEDESEAFLARREHIRKFKTVEAMLTVLHEFNASIIKVRL